MSSSTDKKEVAVFFGRFTDLLDNISKKILFFTFLGFVSDLWLGFYIGHFFDFSVAVIIASFSIFSLPTIFMGVSYIFLQIIGSIPEKIEDMGKDLGDMAGYVKNIKFQDNKGKWSLFSQMCRVFINIISQVGAASEIKGIAGMTLIFTNPFAMAVLFVCFLSIFIKVGSAILTGLVFIF